MDVSFFALERLRHSSSNVSAPLRSAHNRRPSGRRAPSRAPRQKECPLGCLFCPGALPRSEVRISPLRSVQDLVGLACRLGQSQNRGPPDLVGRLVLLSPTVPRTSRLSPLRFGQSQDRGPLFFLFLRI